MFPEQVVTPERPRHFRFLFARQADPVPAHSGKHFFGKVRSLALDLGRDLLTRLPGDIARPVPIAYLSRLQGVIKHLRHRFRVRLAFIPPLDLRRDLLRRVFVGVLDGNGMLRFIICKIIVDILLGSGYTIIRRFPSVNNFQRFMQLAINLRKEFFFVLDFDSVLSEIVTDIIVLCREYGNDHIVARISVIDIFNRVQFNGD